LIWYQLSLYKPAYLFHRIINLNVSSFPVSCAFPERGDCYNRYKYTNFLLFMEGYMKKSRIISKAASRLFFSIAIISLFILPGCNNSSASKNLLGLLADIDKSGSALIKASTGGTVRLNDEVTLTIPADSLIEDTNITIERVKNIPAGEADGLSGFGQAYRFLPKGTGFDLSAPAMLEMNYDSTALASKGFSADTMQICYYDESLSCYVPVNCWVDASRNKIIAQVEHFTVYLPMAKALLATNNDPYVGLQAPVPNGIRAGAPIYIRATVTDFDGAIAGVTLKYRKLQPVSGGGVWHTVRMTKESNHQATLHTFGYLIPSSFLTAADLGTGNDIEYRVEAVDNLGSVQTSTVRRYNVTLTYQPGSLNISPATLDITAGFQRIMLARGIDNNNAAFTLVPETFAMSDGACVLQNRFAQGILLGAVTATPSGSPDQLEVGFGSESAIASVNVHPGEIESLEILDTNGLSIAGDLYVSEGTVYAFDVVGHDGYGNNMPVIPVWSADAGIGILDPDGVLDTTGAHGPGVVSASLAYSTDTQNVVVQSRAKEITAFSINGVDGVIAHPFITVTLASVPNVSTLTPVFTTTGGHVTVNSAEQESGVTVNDFTDPVVYRVTAEDGSTKDYTVNVVVPVSGITINTGSVTILLGEKCQLSGSVVPANASNRSVTWTSGNNSIASVNSEGLVTGSGMGTATITVRTEDGGYTATCSVSVVDRIWTERSVPGAMSKVYWSDIDASSDGLKIIAADLTGYLYTSTDGGTTWTQRSAGGPATGRGSWRGVATSQDGTRLAAALTSEYIYTSADGGATWIQRATSGKRIWNGIVSSADGSRLAGVVSGGYIYTSTDGGATWSENTSSGSKNWWKIVSSSDGMKLAAIANNNYISTSDDGGATWIERTTAGSRAWSSIACSSDGMKLTASTNGYMYVSDDGGSAWSEITGCGSKYWMDVFSSSDGSRLIGVTPGTIAISNNRGATWNLISPSTNEQWVEVAASSDGNYITLASWVGFIYTSSDSCATLVPHRNLGTRMWSDIASSADGTRLAAANDYGYIYTSTDGGATWTEQSGSPVKNWDGIASSDDGMRLAAVTYDDYIYTSSDGGATWTARSSAGRYPWADIACSADGMRLAAAAGYGNRSIFTSTDGGATWVERTSAGSRNWASICSSSDGMKLVAGVSLGYVYTSTNGGATWTEQTSLGTRYWNSIASTPAGDMIVAVAGNFIYTSADGGATWNQKYAAGSMQWMDVAISSNGLRIAAAVNQGYLYVSNDGGLTWSQQVSAGSGYWRSIASSADGSKLAATGNFMKNIFTSDL
jgi:photosystem II stability/assembly factor-like uncharacterized protein